MFFIIGTVVVIVCVIGGYTGAGGHMGVVAFLLQRGSFVDMQDWQVGGLGGGWGVVQLGGGLVMGRRRV